jgi:hypothetical protein
MSESFDRVENLARGLSLAQRFAYNHSSGTKHSSLYMLVNYATEMVGARFVSTASDSE